MLTLGGLLQQTVEPCGETSSPPENKAGLEHLVAHTEIKKGLTGLGHQRRQRENI